MKNFIKGMITGLITGIAAGIIMAPKSGKETRENLSKMAGDVGEKITAKFGEIKEFTKEKYESVINEIMEAENYVNLDEDKKRAIKNELKRSFNRIKEIARD